jgi:hypothetical protein
VSRATWRHAISHGRASAGSVRCHSHAVPGAPPTVLLRAKQLPVLVGATGWPSRRGEHRDIPPRIRPTGIRPRTLAPVASVCESLCPAAGGLRSTHDPRTSAVIAQAALWLPRAHCFHRQEVPWAAALHATRTSDLLTLDTRELVILSAMRLPAMGLTMRRAHFGWRATAQDARLTLVRENGTQ